MTPPTETQESKKGKKHPMYPCIHPGPTPQQEQPAPSRTGLPLPKTKPICKQINKNTRNDGTVTVFQTARHTRRNQTEPNLHKYPAITQRKYKAQGLPRTRHYTDLVQSIAINKFNKSQRFIFIFGRVQTWPYTRREQKFVGRKFSQIWTNAKE